MAEEMISSRWARWLAVASWGLIALAYLTFFLIDLRLDFAQLQIPCRGADCNYVAISPDEFEVLKAWGLSPRAFALIMSGITVAGAGVAWVLSGLILWRQGATRIGWSIALVLMVMPVTFISDADNLADNVPALFIPSVILSQVGIAIFLLFLYLFPNGRFYPRWAYVPFTASYLLFAGFFLAFGGLIALPEWALETAVLFVVGTLAVTLGLQVLRYRNVSTAQERQQTKWVLLGFFMVGLSFPLWFLLFGGVLEIAAGLPRLLATLGGWLLTASMIAVLPVTLAIAIMRYRLWEIDLVIRRTLIYSALTAVLAAAYLGSVLALQGIFQALTGERQNELVTVLSTLGIAALFGPVQRRVQAGIDRRFYRKKYDTARTLAAFGAQARDVVELEQLSERLLGVVEETMQPETASLWVKGGGTRGTGGTQEG